MSARQRWVVFSAGVGVLGLGLLTGIGPGALVRPDQRTVVPIQYDEAAPQRQTSPVPPDQKALAGPEATNTLWAFYLRKVDVQLAQKNVSGAEVAWRDAYVAALRSRRWESLVEVGNAALRIGEVAGSRKAAEARARQLYLAAFFQARQQGSLDGVLRTAEAFGALGDREVAEQCLRIAQSLIARNPDAQAEAYMRTLRERLTVSFGAAEHPYYEP